MKDLSIYIHIPFCDHKCIYCDFYSIIKHDQLEEFQSALIKEIEVYSEIYRDDRIIRSIFFGGGTPSLMKPEYISAILNKISSRFIVADDVEITLETNPGTVDKEKISQFKSSGINRLSVGIQSFKEEDLKFLTRIHDKKGAIETVKNAYESGINNISIDLIFNLPHQTKEDFILNLEEAVRLPINHISAYSLILESGTILNKMVAEGKVELNDENLDADIYAATIEFLEARGFKQYEVSNFSHDGFQSRHNNAYWHYKDYLSFGPSAHSFMENKRWWNIKSLRAYIKSVNENGKAIAGDEYPNSDEMFSEYIMLALRSNGIKIKDLENRFNNGWIKKKEKSFIELAKNGFINRDDNCIWLTAKGYAVCDELIMNLLK